MKKLATKGLNGLKKRNKKYVTEVLLNKRTAEVREESHYVVDMFENGKLIESRPIVGHSKHYADDCATNWVEGIIK